MDGLKGFPAVGCVRYDRKAEGAGENEEKFVLGFHVI